MVVLLSFNVNGLYSHSKWSLMWQMLKAAHVDLIVIQKTYLMQKQEYAFSLHAQGHEIFYSHGTSQLAGVLLAVKRNAGISVTKFLPVSPHLGVLDILVMEQPYRMLACYAPTQLKE